jgi:inorganic pyrophosphatase
VENFMSDTSDLELEAQFSQVHPWHGVDPIVDNDRILIYIENAPLSKMKYEIDSASGILKVDHPLETSALPPAAYGFIPRTFCGSKVAQLNSRLRGDRAALDVFLLSEKPIEVHGVLAEAIIIGGLPVKDEGFADDKLIAVLARDPVFGHLKDVSELPIQSLDRICHFLSQESVTSGIEIGEPYNSKRAQIILQAGLDDYIKKFGSLN